MLSQRDDTVKFEQGRIKALQEERLHIQKKTFTKWMNSFLLKARMEVEDLFTDLADGRKLLKLLEIISGEKLGKPNNGKMRVHKIENVNKSLAFLHTKVRLESIGAEDIVDGNPRLILGLLWTIILRFQIQEIEIDVDEDNESSEKKSAKDALLLWCQRKTNGYPAVNIQDFTGSWRSGLGFNALIHSHRPDLIDFDELTTNQHIDNLNHAFDVAEQELGIPRLLDAEDVDIHRPDEKSIITYVASYYHTFARMKNEMKGGRRIANIVGQMMEADKMKLRYERLNTNLLEWIKQKREELEDRNFPNSLEGIQKELLKFKEYRTEEKPPKYKERSEVEALYFNINTQLKALNQPLYSPPEGKLIHDIERAWVQLEKSEHRREVVLREELLRQERLEQLAYTFQRKSILREGYLKEMIQVLSDPRYGSNMSQVEATVKKHEAISADILARRERFHDLTEMADKLDVENFHGKDRIKVRELEILNRWQELLDLLDRHKANLSMCSNLMTMLREADTIMATIQELEDSFRSSDVGPHLLAVEDLMQKHNLQESQVASMGETIKRLNRQGQQYIAANNREAPLLEKKLEKLNAVYAKANELGKSRWSKLEDAHSFYQFLQDHEEEEAWSIEKQRICKTGITAKDLRAVLSLQQKHKTMIEEINARKPRSRKILETGCELVTSNHPESKVIETCNESLTSKWKDLEQLVNTRKNQLQDAVEAYQFYADANEVESWIKEKMPLVCSKDYGEDEPSGQALLQRHRDLEGEIKAYEGDIKGLNSQANALINSGINSLELQSITDVETTALEEEWVKEMRMVPEEVIEEEPYERTEIRMVVEERVVPQVKALYLFQEQERGMSMAKGEILFLMNKTNNDWWNVRKASGQDGFVPASWVKEIEPKVVQVQVKKPEKVRDVRRVKKTIMVPHMVPVKKAKSPKAQARSNELNSHDNETVEKRQNMINEQYQKLDNLSQQRHAFLEDSIRLFGFYRECDDFEKWIKEKAKMLQTDDQSESVESAKRKFEQFLTDLSASSRRIEDIDQMVSDFIRDGHSQLDKVQARQQYIHQLWDNLNQLKSDKERSLEGASSVELFNRTCDEAHDWMLEKMNKMDTDELGKDLRTVQALQLRHEHLERELSPVEDKVKRIDRLADSVKASYPNERGNVNGRQREMQVLWDQLKDKANSRRSRLEEAVGQQIFTNSSNNLLEWVEEVKQSLNADEPARDVTTAEIVLKKHQELGDDINAHQDEFKEVLDLGTKLVKRNPHSKEIQDVLDRLQAEAQAIQRGWQEKGDWLRQCMDLQLFNREADQIDAVSRAHEAFLDYQDLGETLDDVEALEKRHDDFENTLIAQDERLKSFSEMADKLIEAGHYDSKGINNRRNSVLLNREAVKNKSHDRKSMLVASEKYQEFKAEVDDMRRWIVEKHKLAVDESFRDLSNLERKLKKHEAFERELRANEGRLRNINKNGQRLMLSKHYNSDEIAKNLGEVNAEWDVLCALAQSKGCKLHQAAAQHVFNKSLDDTKNKLDEVEKSLSSEEVGTDLHSCKKLLNQHQMLEGEISQLDQKIANLVSNGKEMQQDGHFDGDKIVSSGAACEERFRDLQNPLARRRAHLNESLAYQKFVFEVEAQHQWIKEHLTPATADTLGQNLHQAQMMFKKHKKLQAEIEGHEPLIDKTLALGRQLIDEQHSQTQEVEGKCLVLRESWQELEDAAKERNKNLELSLKAQQFFFDANEVESWMNEKNGLLSSKDYGKDEDAAIKLLTKQKGLELELDTYAGLVSEMGNMTQSMVNSKHPDSKLIQNRQQLISQQLKNLLKMANTRRSKLMESMYRHEYFRESEELEKWINEQLQAATAEDYGQDYEHLLILLGKFEDFKHRVESGSERFNQCEELAKKLIASESPYSADINTRQNQLSLAWNNLLDHIEVRDQKLQAAGEIHRFNRDVSDALSRIQEKYSSIPEDLGRALRSVEALIRKHEGFENDLVALEAQLQVLVDDAVRLQGLYPGANAEHIQQQQKMVIDNWNALQDKAAQRKEELRSSCDFHKFMSTVRDLINWVTNLQTSMTTEEKVRDVASAQIVKAEHERLKAEIEAREQNFSAAVQSGDAMIREHHPMTEEIQEKIRQLLDERARLHSAWQQKKVYLDQLIDLHFFLRDAKQLDTICGTQESALSGTEFGTTAEEVDIHAKKHEAFEKLLVTQEEKFLSLQEHAAKLVKQQHFDSDNICAKLGDVIQKRSRVKNLCAVRKQRIIDGLLYAQFVRDVNEAEAWIEEKQKHLDLEVNKGVDGVSNLEEKIKKLQKHQAFQAELTANEGRIQQITEKGELLLHKRHPSSPEVRQVLDHLLKKWQQLFQDSINCGRGLEEAQDILEFNNQVEKIEAWIRDKEMMVQVGDIGRDYEHCLALQRKLEDMDSDMRVDDSRMKGINGLANKLIHQGRSETKALMIRRDELNQKWRNLQGALDEYRDHLAGALEIHAFNRDVDDTNERINEKAVAMSSDDTGKDLSGVEALQRKQDKMERDMTAIHGKLQEHTKAAKILTHKYPDVSKSIQDKLCEVEVNWGRLQQICKNRRAQLASANLLQKFKSELKEAEDWMHVMNNKLNEVRMASNSEETEAFLQLHQERKAEIVGREENVTALHSLGAKVTSVSPDHANEVTEDLKILDETYRSLLDNWETARNTLAQGRHMQRFEELAEQADEWLAAKEAVLSNDDVGDSMSSVDNLLRKHDDFEKTLQAQGSRINDLEKFGNELLSGKHHDSDKIEQRLRDICQRHKRLLELSETRRNKLHKSKELHQFLRNVYEVEGWLSEKLQVTLDESWLEMSNLQSKMQKHQAFEAELVANRGRVEITQNEGESLIHSNHFAKDEIAARLDDVEMLWQQLHETSKQKREHLHQAHQALIYFRTLDDLESWVKEVETQLQSEDHGRDLTSVQNLLKRHQQLEADVTSHAAPIEQVKESSNNFQNVDHFLKEDIQERSTVMFKRYQALHEPMQIRRENLEDALLLQQFLRDAEDELQWISEKDPLASSTDLGASLTGVQSLQKKHQALETEILSHQPVISTLIQRAEQMMRVNHFAEKEIESQMGELRSGLTHLKDQASIRRLRLLDAVESQTFYAEASEALVWMKEKLPVLTSGDYGKDEGSVQSLQKKLDNVQKEIINFDTTVVKLAKLSQALIDRGHFDSDNITEKQLTIESKYTDLQSLVSNREQHLEANGRLFGFLREVDSVSEWIGEQMAAAASEDYGRDVEHVEVLIQKFEAFLSTLTAKEERIKGVKTSAEIIIRDGHPDSSKIQLKCDEVQQLWDDLKELAHARQEALAGAKLVHVFDRNADETIGWIQEKDTLLSLDDYGHDLESIQVLRRKHQGLESDLEAIKKPVEEVVEEAQRLAQLFPDASEHISVKHEETVEAWKELLEKSAERKDRLHQAEHIQAYFDQYRDLLAWINEMLAKMTSPELSRDVPGAEALMSRHREYKTEIDARTDAFTKFSQNGRKLITEGHFLSEEIEDKVSTLEQRHQYLLETWSQRMVIYEHNLDMQLFYRDADQLESWIQTREPLLRDSQLGESIAQTEDLLKKHEDFEKTFQAQEVKLEIIHRVTKIEEAFRAQREAELAAKKTEAQRVEKERVENIKRKEVQRITDERRREDERRRTQEIKFNREDLDRSNTQLNGNAPLTPQNDKHVWTIEEPLSGSPLRRIGSQSSIGGGDIRRRGEDSGDGRWLSPQSVVDGLTGGDIKRAESMKVDSKKPKRTPSFTTRRRTQSFRKLKQLDHLQNLPPVESEGFLERKHELQTGGKKAAMRSWKTLYSVLCGQMLCFFKEQEDFLSSKASSSPILIYHAQCEKAHDYIKRKHVFRLRPTDGSEYLFAVETETQMDDWVKKINFHAQLPPSMQLLSYDSQKGVMSSTISTVESVGDKSSSSSEQNSPDTNRKTIPEPIYVNYQPKQQEPLREKPPVPPRNISLYGDPSPIVVQGRIQSLPDPSQQGRIQSLPPDGRHDDFVTSDPHGYGIRNQNGNSQLDGREVWMRRNSRETAYPSLPHSQPPQQHGRSFSMDGQQKDKKEQHVYSNVPVTRQSYQYAESKPPAVLRTGSLPPNTIPPNNYGNHHHRKSDSSSESDVPGATKEKEKKSGGGLIGLFRKKRATNL